MSKELESRYFSAAERALAALRAVENKIHDMPAPGGEMPINWGHFGDMMRIVEQLEEIANVEA